MPWLDLPPGLARYATELQSAGRWRMCNLVRWVEGIMQPVGGWQALTGGSPVEDLEVTGKARGSHAWQGNDSTPYLVVGTHSHLYAYSGGDLFDITPTGLASGRADTESYVGFGIGPFGRGPFGVARSAAGGTERATTWSLDNFGELLLGIHSDDQRLMVWENDYGAIAEPVVASAGTVPTGKAVVTTEERFLFVLAAGGNPRKVQWCDQEDHTDWEVTSTTQAGDFELTSTGELRTGKRIGDVVLLMTDDDAHIASFVGRPLIYSFQQVATGCGVVSPQACAAVDDVAFWMSKGSFYRYDGTVKPIPCAVHEYVFEGINTAQLEKVCAVRVPEYREVWWFYPSTGSLECDRYVGYNIDTDVWFVGECARTTAVPSGVYSTPIYVGADGKIYQHETGKQFGGDDPYCESFPVQIGDGERIMRVDSIIPDERTAGQLTLTLRARNYPNGSEITKGPYTLANPTSVRATGRQMVFRVDGAEGQDWRMGRFRYIAKETGQR